MKKSDYFPFAFSPLALSVAVIIALLLVFSIRSVMVAWRDSEPVPITDKAAAVEEQSLPSPAAAAPVPAEQPVAAPVTVQSSQGPPALPQEDFETIWQREEAQREAIRVLRQEARETPEGDSIPTEKEIKELEKSGALLR